MSEAFFPPVVRSRDARVHSLTRAVALAVLILFCAVPRGDADQFAQVGQIRIDENTIVSWVFNNQQSIEQVRKELDEIIQTRIDLIASSCELTPEQREKLLLAGAGDIHRFFNEYDSLRRNIRIGNVSQQEYQDIWTKIEPLRRKFAGGLHTRDSLFARSITYVLDAKQQIRYEEFERQRKRRKYESMVKGAIAMIEGEIPLTKVQRDKLLKLTLEQDASVQVDTISYYQIYLVLYQMTKIPEDQLKPIFLENEWKSMQFLLNRVQGYQQMLQREGLLDE